MALIKKADVKAHFARKATQRRLAANRPMEGVASGIPAMSAEPRKGSGEVSPFTPPNKALRPSGR